MEKNNKNILTVDDLIDYTGYSQKQIYKLTSTRAIPHYKPNGRKLFFKRNEVDNWITQGRIKPMSELDYETQNIAL